MGPSHAVRAFLALSLIALLLGTQPVRVRASSHAPAHYRWFWVQGTTGIHHVRTVRLAAGPHVHVYAPVQNWVSGPDAWAVEGAFERAIFPTDTRIFGYPRHLAPVDILFLPLDTATLGYFDQNDVTPWMVGGDPAHSNRDNLLYVRLPSAMPDRDRLGDVKEVVAHELQHLIEYRLRVVDHRLAAEPDWLNEGLSFYAQVANGYWTPRDLLKAQAASASPWWPVTALRNDVIFLRHNARLAYGRAGLFVTYLAEQYGPGFIHDLVASKLAGMQAVDATIRAHDGKTDAASAFADWSVAQYLDSSGRYSYGPLSRVLTVRPAMALPDISAFPFDTQRTSVPHTPVEGWGQEYLRFSAHASGTLNVDVSGPAAEVRVAAIFEDSRGSVVPQVHWLTFRRGDRVAFHVPDFGEVYDRVIVAVNSIPSRPTENASPATAVRVRARLINVRDDY